MAGAEKYADHPPQKTTHGPQQEPLTHPGVYGEKKLVHASFHSQLFQFSNDGGFLHESFVPDYFFAFNIVENLGGNKLDAVLPAGRAGRGVVGDPSGRGDGDIGYTVKDEIDPGARYDKPGLVGMANFGPNTNGSQFFITVGPAPDLNSRHTLFGEVTDGLEVAAAISKVPRNELEHSNRPLKPVTIKTLRIVER